MAMVLIGLVVIGIGVYNMVKDKQKFDNDIVDYMNSIQETLNSLKDKDD